MYTQYVCTVLQMYNLPQYTFFLLRVLTATCSEDIALEVVLSLVAIMVALCLLKMFQFVPSFL